LGRSATEKKKETAAAYSVERDYVSAGQFGVRIPAQVGGFLSPKRLTGFEAHLASYSRSNGFLSWG